MRVKVKKLHTHKHSLLAQRAVDGPAHVLDRASFLVTPDQQAGV